MSGKVNKRARRLVKTQAEAIKRKLIVEICDLPLRHRILVALAILFKRKPEL